LIRRLADGALAQVCVVANSASTPRPWCTSTPDVLNHLRLGAR